jgi:hypothetical protein
MLTEMQRSFAKLFVQTDGRDAAACADAAGYGSPKQRAYELLHDDEVLEEIRRLVSSRFCAALARAESKVEEIMDDDEGSKNRAVQLKAAQAVLAHGGLLLERLATLNINVRHQVSTLPPGQALAAELLQEMSAMGLAFVDDGARFREYCASLDRIAGQQHQPQLIDITPHDVEEWHA